MIERATGLIIRTRPFTETSLIVQWLTAEHGRLSTVAKGARRPKSPLRGKLDLFYLADFSFNRSRRSELHTLSEVSLRETHAALRRDLDYLQQASYCAALIELSTEKETPLPIIFELMRNFLDALTLTPAQSHSILAFELKLLTELGLEPGLAENRLTPGARQVIGALQRNDWTAISRLKLSESQEKEVGTFLKDFLLFHLGKIPRSRP